MTRMENEDSQSIEPDGLEPQFRAVVSDGRRHGLRLERRFWQMLGNIAKRNNASISDVVSEVNNQTAERGNLASKLRVHAIETLWNQVERLETKTSIAQIEVILNACPSPAIAISTTSSFRFYNASFIRYARVNLMGSQMDTVDEQLRLQIDMPVAELVQQIKAGEKDLVTIGFVIGMNNRRVRGQLNTILAPCHSEEIVLGYVTS